MTQSIMEDAPLFAPELNKDVVLNTPDLTVSGRLGQFSKSGLLWLDVSTETRAPSAFRAADDMDQFVSIWLFTKGRRKFLRPEKERYTFDKNNALYASRLQVEGLKMEIDGPDALGAFLSYVPLPTLANWFGGRLPNELRPLVKDKFPQAMLAPVANGYLMQSLAVQIEAYGEPLKTMARESLAMQLMTLYLHELCGSEARDTSLSSREIRATKDARERLLSDLENPPSTSELALLADMAERRLDFAFRELFSASIFKTLTNARLNYAYQALLTGKISIKELAFRLGYKHPSSFSQAFRKRFGRFPSQIGR